MSVGLKEAVRIETVPICEPDIEQDFVEEEISTIPTTQLGPSKYDLTQYL